MTELFALSEMVLSSIFCCWLDLISICNFETSLSNFANRNIFQQKFLANRVFHLKCYNQDILRWLCQRRVVVDSMFLGASDIGPLHHHDNFDLPRIRKIILDNSLSGGTPIALDKVSDLVKCCKPQELEMLNFVTNRKNDASYLPHVPSLKLVGSSVELLKMFMDCESITIRNLSIVCITGEGLKKFVTMHSNLHTISLSFTGCFDLSSLLNHILSSCNMLISLSVEYFSRLPSQTDTINLIKCSMSMTNFRLVMRSSEVKSNDTSFLTFCKSCPQLKRVMYRIGNADTLPLLFPLLASCPQLIFCETFSFMFNLCYEGKYFSGNDNAYTWYDELALGEGPIVFLYQANDAQVNALLDVLQPLSFDLLEGSVSEHTISNRIRKLKGLKALNIDQVEVLHDEATFLGICKQQHGGPGSAAVHQLLSQYAEQPCIVYLEDAWQGANNNSAVRGVRIEVSLDEIGPENRNVLWNYIINTKRDLIDIQLPAGTIAEISYCLGYFHKLEKIDVAVNDELMFMISLTCDKTLVSLGVDEGGPSLTNEGLQLVLRRCRKLTMLTVHKNCTSVDSGLLGMIATHAPQLEYLSLHRINVDYRAAITEMLAVCKKLKRFPLNPELPDYFLLRGLIESYGVAVSQSEKWY